MIKRLVEDTRVTNDMILDVPPIDSVVVLETIRDFFQQFPAATDMAADTVTKRRAYIDALDIPLARDLTFACDYLDIPDLLDDLTWQFIGVNMNRKKRELIKACPVDAEITWITTRLDEYRQWLTCKTIVTSTDNSLC